MPRLYHHVEAEPFAAAGIPDPPVVCCDGGNCIGAIPEAPCAPGPIPGPPGPPIIGSCDTGGGAINCAPGLGAAPGAGGAGATPGGIGATPGGTGENCSWTGGISWIGTGVIIGAGPFGPMSKSMIEG